MKELNIELLNYFWTFSNIEFIEKNIWLLADAPIFFIPIFLLWYWIYYSFSHSISKSKTQEKKINLLFILYTIVWALVTSLVIQQFVHIDRPEWYINTTWKLLMEHLPDASFPSDHATVSCAFVFSLFFTHYHKIGFLFLPFVIIMNVSRVIAGVHWPFDILAWLFVGLIANFIIFEYVQKWSFIKKFNSFVLKMMAYIKL